ncbi:MAG: helix-turn-helix transcriptional regulator [Cytophagales bacterium]|nr:helix-turn-helix transcriptional regulator [Cytophagales bacterium]
MLKIGKKLRQLRAEKGYSQEYLAHELNMTQGNYCKLESDSHFPSSETLEKIAALYNTTPQELLASDGQTQVQYNNNYDSSQSVNAFFVWQDPQKLVEDLIASKEKIIALQARQIEILESRLKNESAS